VQRLCDVHGEGVETTRQRAVARVIPAVITGHTTPALSDVGCASVRLRFLDALATSGSQGAPLKHDSNDRTLKHGVEDGGYLLAIQRLAIQNKPLQTEGQGQRVRGRREWRESPDVAGDAGACGSIPLRGPGGQMYSSDQDSNDSGRETLTRAHRQTGGLLAAISAVPGDKGLDRYENSRQVQGLGLNPKP